MGLFGKFKSSPAPPPSIINLDPCSGDVLTFQSEYGTYLTACADKSTVSLQEKLPAGSNGPQCWTVVRYRPKRDWTVFDRYFLKSIYGTFLAAREGVNSSGIHDVYQTCWPAGDSSPLKDIRIGRLLWQLRTGERSSNSLSTWCSLRELYYGLWPEEDGRLQLCLRSYMSWLVRLVDWDKNAVIIEDPWQQQNTPTSAPIPSAMTPPAPPNTASAAVADHPSPPNMMHDEHREKSDKAKVVHISFNNHLGSNSRPGDPSLLYNTGQNFNGSGTQKNGDVDIRNQAGTYGNLYFQFP